MNTPVQLGWLSTAINYVFDRILNPFFGLLNDVISEVFSWIFNTALGPVLQAVSMSIVGLVAKLLWIIISRILFRIECCLLSIVDMMQNIFNVLAGIAKVTDKDTGATGSILTIIARKPFVVNTLLIIIAIAFILCFVFAILATIKSISDMGGPKSQSVGHVLRQTANALLRMIFAPALGIFLILLGDAVMVSISNAMTLDNNVTIARSLFVISTLDAVDETNGAVDISGKKITDDSVLAYNYSTRPKYLASHPGAGKDYGLTDKFRLPFYNGSKDYTKATYVDETFDMTKMDFLVGIGGAILFVFILGTTLFVLVSRIFDVLVLLLVEPFFIASMPIDDGEHFKKWEDMFIAKLFSGYGMVVAMYLYLLVTSLVFGGTFSFTPRNDAGDIMMDMLTRIVLLVGGAASVMTAGPLVTSILNSAAAGEEARASAAGTMFTGTTMGYAFNAVTSGAGLLNDKVTNSINNWVEKKEEDEHDKFVDKKPENKSSNTFKGNRYLPVEDDKYLAVEDDDDDLNEESDKFSKDTDEEKD